MFTSTNPSSEPSSVQALTVSQLNMQIKGLLESGIGAIWVKGEISNCKPHNSGHLYFSLKDQQSQIKAVMFRANNGRLRFKPQDGLEVLAYGQVSAYVPRGDYQIYVEHMEPLGTGALQKAFEELKNRLFQEGLFDPKRKRPIPKRPRKIAIITSPTGAAIRDILNILKRRVPSIPVLLIPALVQGASASTDLIRALDLAQRLSGIDVIILGRGGGSIEDLWCFNDEQLARKIAESKIPVISAVGHEIDYTISDFVADLRAPTPSAAAELVAEADQDLRLHVQKLFQQILLLLKKQIQWQREKFQVTVSRLVHPQKRIMELLQKRDELVDRLILATQNHLKTCRNALNIMFQKLQNQRPAIEPIRLLLRSYQEGLIHAWQSTIQNKQHAFAKTVALLDSLSPLNTLKRGFGYQTHSSGQLIRSVKEVLPEQEMITHLYDGRIYSKVTRIQKEEPWSSKKN